MALSSDGQCDITWGGLVIDVEGYLEILDLFRFRYDPAVLGLIAERPHRFRELVNRLESHLDGHVDDNAVDRSLKRLARVNHVTKAQTRSGNNKVRVYSITHEGRLHLRVYHAFIDAYRRIQQDDERPASDDQTA